MRNWRSRLAALALSTLPLAGCSSPPSVCPPVVQYDDAFKARLSTELHGLGEGSAAATMVKDYVTLREQVAACR